jgi:hypothetical protein
MEWIIAIVTVLAGLVAIVEFLKQIYEYFKKRKPPVTQNRPTPPSGQTEEHHDPAAGISASPATVRIYTLGPHGGSFGTLSWTTEYAGAKERWDAFWKSHSAGQAGIATSPADNLLIVALPA